ncbi:MAG: FAD-binding oxidoreductase [Acidimicrobiales bacterium]
MAERRRRSWWGWGYDDEAMTADQVAVLAAVVGDRLGRALEIRSPPSLDDVDLRPPRVAPPKALAHVCSRSTVDRASHTYGKSYRDIVRAFHRQLPHPPDVVAYPNDESEVVDVLDWCAGARIAAIPFGGGSSVVGGVECAVGDDFAGAVSIDLTRLDRVLEIDPISRSARIQAGAVGPVLEAQLRPHELTLRHFPQSFECSTLGGWLATRSGGHYATLYTHIDDLVESMRVVTPAGTSESRRLPGSGAGPSPDRLFLGSEGALGIITEAWMRVQHRPGWRASAAVHFAGFLHGAQAVRAISQAGLYPTNCRLLDGREAELNIGTTGSAAVLVLGFESADHPVDGWIDRALELARDHGGEVPAGVRRIGPTDDAGGTARDGAVGAWRAAFLRAPYTRDGLIQCGVLADTFETACTWDRFPDLHASVVETVERELREIGGRGWVTCRFTHVYPDGPAPYFSVIAPTRFGSELALWDEIKAAASEAILAAAGTITHHHAVGRDHDAWYRRQRPAAFGDALAAAKAVLDPAGVLNPGVLV